MPYQLIDILISISLFLIMFTIGLSLYIKDFKKIFKYPKKLFVGLTSQIILLPLLTFLILQFSNLSVEIKIGILILMTCPGGSTSNFISYLIKADTPLSISLTSINTLIGLISIPLIINFFLKYYLGSNSEIILPFLNTIITLLIIVIIPVLIGIYIKKKNQKLAEKIEKNFKIISIILLAIVFGIKFFANEAQGGSGITFIIILSILPTLLLIHLISLNMGFFNSKLFKINNKSAITIGIEVGLQNTVIALLITNTILKNSLITQPILVYAIFSFFTTTLFGIIMKKVLTKEGIRKEIKIEEVL